MGKAKNTTWDHIIFKKNKGGITCILTFILRFCCKSTAVLLRSCFYNSRKDSAVYNVGSFAFGLLRFVVKVYSLLLNLQNNFIPWVIWSLFLLFVLLYLVGKLA